LSWSRFAGDEMGVVCVVFVECLFGKH